MRKLFQYQFLNMYLMTTYRLVELSARRKRNVPHSALLVAGFITLAVARPGKVTSPL